MTFIRFILFLPVFIFTACGQGEPTVFNLETAAQKWNWQGIIWTEAELRLLDQGEKHYRVNCSACHSRDGEGDNQMGAPALRQSPLAMGQKADLIVRILKGKKGSSMPAFAPSLSDQEVAGIATYVRNAWGNSSGDTVLQAEVTRLR
jgi:cytochrome c oxidase subunit 2